MNPVLALSTSWCSQRHKDGYDMLREIADLGFRRVELSHGIRITLVPGILRALEERVIEVGSTHNFCPLPVGVTQAAPNVFQPSSPDGRERDQWVRQTKRSIDFAAQVGARVLVCHLGSVPYLWFNPYRRLASYLRAHPDAVRTDDPAYRTLRERALAKLRGKAPDPWKRTLDCIQSVLGHASDKHVSLGFENREAFEELPIDSDFPALLESLPPPSPVGYWHDAGHAHIKAAAGLLSHREHLGSNAKRLLGFHLHDVDAEGHDHQAVGSGTIDFAMLAEFFSAEQTFVLELSPRVPVEGVVSSKARLDALLAGINPRPAS